MSPRSQAALLGGAFIGVLSALPFISVGNCCCLWILGGGFLAAYLLQHEQPAAVTIGDGAAVGLLAGIIGAFVHLIVFVPVDLLMAPLQARLLERMMANARDVPPGIQAFLDSASGSRTSFGAHLAFQFVPMLVVGVVFAPVGGMLGALFTRRELPPPAANTTDTPFSSS
jgi:hypothetical protein